MSPLLEACRDRTPIKDYILALTLGAALGVLLALFI